MAQEVILRLDEAQDFRQLSTAEFNLRSKLKKRLTSWLVVEKARKNSVPESTTSVKAMPTPVSSTLGPTADEGRTSCNISATMEAGSLSTTTNNASSRSTSPMS
jgi:hypothetical protein